MKKLYCIIIICLCVALLLTVLLVSCAPEATLFIEPVEEQKDFALEHELLDWKGACPEFSYAEYLERRFSDFEESSAWEEALKEAGDFYADMPYTEQNITSVQQAVDYFYGFKDIEVLNVPEDWVIYWIKYDREYDVWQITAGQEGKEPWNHPDLINDGTWCWFFRGNGQLLFSEWG